MNREIVLTHKRFIQKGRFTYENNPGHGVELQDRGSYMGFKDLSKENNGIEQQEKYSRLKRLNYYETRRFNPMCYIIKRFYDVKTRLNLDEQICQEILFYFKKILRNEDQKKIKRDHQSHIVLAFCIFQCVKVNPKYLHITLNKIRRAFEFRKASQAVILRYCEPFLKYFNNKKPSLFNHFLMHIINDVYKDLSEPIRLQYFKESIKILKKIKYPPSITNRIIQKNILLAVVLLFTKHPFSNKYKDVCKKYGVWYGTIHVYYHKYVKPVM